MKKDNKTYSTKGKTSSKSNTKDKVITAPYIMTKPDGTKHYVPYSVPQNKQAFEAFVIQKAKERLEKTPLCLNQLKKQYSLDNMNMQDVWNVVTAIVKDSVYYNRR